jgi:hypothetical protein
MTLLKRFTDASFERTGLCRWAYKPENVCPHFSCWISDLRHAAHTHARARTQSFFLVSGVSRSIEYAVCVERLTHGQRRIVATASR